MEIERVVEKYLAEKETTYEDEQYFEAGYQERKIDVCATCLHIDIGKFKNRCVNPQNIRISRKYGTLTFWVSLNGVCKKYTPK
jgi:hypothetical protein